ncbi:ABC transporter ATP-binding protein [Blastococcus goldschmidtiae]|uniref:ABC transporter ATP-binding protein n=1 Tax=Blastococcus goldschmidtiae TaxID=3075546 RepID=A0ABU2K7M6_9ACTN|nr:ABC transporter ATP-binding protein [Blastococcus sp. DSM 46792]MDT0276201.1 ABC transporter ATP-binding protein [Blastococcus sp. DSM 46792]
MTPGAPDRAPTGGARDVVLRTTGLTWRVGGFTIVEDIDLEVREGEFLSVIGPNGAGKSTLINLLSGVAVPVAGRIELLGKDVTRAAPSTRVRRGLGRTFQTSSLFPGLTVLENARLAAAGARGSLALWRRPSPTDAATRKARNILEEVGLGHRAHDRAADLGHGDKRKLEIGVVLCGDPRVLLLDEPTAGVSAEEVEPLVDVVRAVHARGRTVVMVEHHMELVTGVSDRIAVMHQGRLLMVDVPSVVMADATVGEAYLGGGFE